MDWVKGHVRAASDLGKPLCLQEFGKRPAGRARTKLFKKVRPARGGATAAQFRGGPLPTIRPRARRRPSAAPTHPPLNNAARSSWPVRS